MTDYDPITEKDIAAQPDRTGHPLNDAESYNPYANRKRTPDPMQPRQEPRETDDQDAIPICNNCTNFCGWRNSQYALNNCTTNPTRTARPKLPAPANPCTKHAAEYCPACHPGKY